MTPEKISEACVQIVHALKGSYMTPDGKTQPVQDGINSHQTAVGLNTKPSPDTQKGPERRNEDEASRSVSYKLPTSP